MAMQTQLCLWWFFINRYADTILLGIPRIPNFFNATRAKEHARTILKNYCDKLDLDVSWEELWETYHFSWWEKKSLTGLLVSFTDSGGIKVRIPLKMWGKSISTGRLVQEFRGGLNRLTMANFLKLLNEHVEAYLRTSFQYPLSHSA